MAPDGNGGCEMRLEQVHEVGECERGYEYAVFLAVEGERLIAPGRSGIGFPLCPASRPPDTP